MIDSRRDHRGAQGAGIQRLKDRARERGGRWFVAANVFPGAALFIEPRQRPAAPAGATDDRVVLAGQAEAVVMNAVMDQVLGVTLDNEQIRGAIVGLVSVPVVDDLVGGQLPA